MSDIGAMVSDLIEAGCAPEVAAQVVARAFTAGVASADVRGLSADVSAERRREKDRLRKQEERERLRKSADVRGNPQMSENASLSNTTINNLSLERERERNGSVRGHRLPDDWVPDLAWAIAQIGARAEGEIDKFRDHWKQQPGSKGVKLDWDAAWRNWIRRAAEYQAGGKNGKTGIIQAADDLRRKIASFDGPPSGDRQLRSGSSPPVVRLLPNGGCE